MKRIARVFPIVIILNDEQISERILKAIKSSVSILNEENIPVEQLWSRGKSLLSRIFSLIYLGDFTSFYLAILNKTDPTPVNKIDTLKKRLSQNIKY